MITLGKEAKWYPIAGPGGCLGILAYDGRLVRIDDTLGALLALVPPAEQRADGAAWDEFALQLLARKVI